MEAIALEAKVAMEKTITSLLGQFNTIRTGRANASLLDRVLVDYYGEPTPVSQLASIAVPEPRQLLIKPYDKGDIKSIVEAINKAELGINPIAEADVVRLQLPALTEDRRKELAKQAGLEGSNGHYEYDWFDPDKFAKLIISECAGVCEDYRGTEWGKAAECIGDSIKEHFGVEE